jgi:outer membrane protein
LTGTDWLEPGFQGVELTSMTSKLLRALLAVAVISMISAWAQTAGAVPNDPATSAAAAAAAPSAPNTATATGAGMKIGTINIQQAVLGSNEGQRDFDALQKKLDPKQAELKSQNDELEALQKQLQTQGDKLNEEARASLVQQIETKKKAFDRAVQDAQDDAQNQEKEIFQRILQTMAPVIVKHAQQNGYTMIVDTTNQWPQSPILWYDGNRSDITKAVVDLYNTQSGVPPPAAQGTGPKPAAAKPAAPKPAAPKTSTPQ